VRMKDGNEWPVSRRQHDYFLNTIKQHTLTFKK
jgi:hypothetical protein